MSKVKLLCSWQRFIHFRGSVYNNCKWVVPTGSKANINVYNPITKNQTPLILRNKTATWYMCGPTVYDSCHIGHACTYVRFDIIRRILSEFFDINVILVMGLTDIDDKIINRSNATGKSWQSLSEYYTKEFLSDMDSLNVKRPFIICKVTNYIPEIIKFVKIIVDKKGAYVGNDGSVYFDSASYTNYGKLSVPLPEEPHPNKKSSLDFALWKAAKENEPFWESPWGRGRPGWHIECSAIASTVLGKNIDIHSGGIDLIFPHHENEEAQSCCYHNVDQWVNYWFHTGHLHLKGNVKMSKSLQNTVSIPSLLNNYTANQFRMICLLSHYRNNISFSDQLIKNAVTVLKKIEFFINHCNDYVSGRYNGGDINESELLTCLEETKEEVISALGDDFNTPRVLNAILKLSSVGNSMIQKQKGVTVARSSQSVAIVSHYLQTITSKLGIISTAAYKDDSDISKILDILVEFRYDVRKRALEENNKDIELLKSCDLLRNALSVQGIEINDRKDKSSWILRQK